MVLEQIEDPLIKRARSDVIKAIDEEKFDIQVAITELRESSDLESKKRIESLNQKLNDLNGLIDAQAVELANLKRVHFKLSAL